MDGKKTVEPSCDGCPQKNKWLWTVWLLPAVLPAVALFGLKNFTHLICCGCYGEQFLIVLLGAYLGVILANLIRRGNDAE